MSNDPARYGVKLPGGSWLAPVVGGSRFWQLTRTPIYTFRTREGADRVAQDWGLVEYTIEEKNN